MFFKGILDVLSGYFEHHPNIVLLFLNRYKTVCFQCLHDISQPIDAEILETQSLVDPLHFILKLLQIEVENSTILVVNGIYGN